MFDMVIHRASVNNRFLMVPSSSFQMLVEELRQLIKGNPICPIIEVDVFSVRYLINLLGLPCGSISVFAITSAPKDRKGEDAGRKKKLEGGYAEVCA